jgi:vitamin B12 transporter
MWVIIFIFLLILPHPCLSDPLALEKIVVKKESNKAAETITGGEIAEQNPGSWIDLLDYLPGLDLRSRGALGIQSDISLRGSTFEQVAVLLDGVKINDPQSGHYNLEIPLNPGDIEKIEVIKEGASSLYGAGAFAGSINIITRKPDKEGLYLSASYGEHALSTGDLSFSLPYQEYSGRFSFGHKSSNGWTSNTDFKSDTASLYLARQLEGSSLHTLLAYQKKDFGADSFYSNLFPEEEEHTQTLLVKSGFSVRKEGGSAENSLYLRRHRDKFILRRNNPTAVNCHTTYVYGLNSDFDIPLRMGELSLGLALANQEINSNNLGKHSWMQEGLKAGFLAKLGEKLDLDINSRMDSFQKWGLQYSWNFGLGYFLNSRMKIESSLAHAFRLPTFTELYYSDAGNKGSPELGVEKSDNASLGLCFRQEKLDLGLNFFYRQGRNLIDWTRSSNTERWQATSLGRVDVGGVEFKSALMPVFNFSGIGLDKISFSYTYNSLAKKKTGLFSKYALDILKDRLSLYIVSSFWGNKLDWELSYSHRYCAETYFIGNLCISREINGEDFIFQPFLRIDNFSNTEYSEVGGVPQPGRWIKAGLRLEW